MRVKIQTHLYCAPTAEISIPGIRSWNKIKDWYVKWDTFHYTLDGDNWLEIPLNNDGEDDAYWKVPQKVTVFNTNDKQIAILD